MNVITSGTAGEKEEPVGRQTNDAADASVGRHQRSGRGHSARRISITAVDAIVEVIESHYNFGLILGALQSGKTTTALALQFAGPAV